MKQEPLGASPKESQYDPAFYDTIRAGCQASAAVVVPLVMKHIEPRTVVDVGCGEGWWGHAFAEFDCDVLGIDGDYMATPAVPEFLHRDLTQTLDLGGRRFDLAVALEVAEHLPPARAASFVEDLCHLAPVVLFSAAIPGQGGHGHINEQWPQYWTSLFNSYGYAVSGALRWEIWDDPRVEPWYKQNTLVATDRPEDYPTLFDTPLSTPWPVVHPTLFQARTGR